MSANTVASNAMPRRSASEGLVHQTKGREADATVLLLQPDEFHGYEPEPYPTGSRLLYVCLTRARERAHIVVPENIHGLHGLWLPFINACIAVVRRECQPHRSGRHYRLGFSRGVEPSRASIS